MDENGQDKIEELNETLYSRTRYSNPLDKRTPVKGSESPEVIEKWQTTDLDEILKRERIALGAHPFMKKVFIFALLFFMGAILVASFVFWGGSTFISSKNVDINVLGPTTASAGEALDLGISVSNKNNADLELANLSIQYPPGSRGSESADNFLTYTKDNLGVIKAGAEAIRHVRVVLLGPIGEVKELKFSVEYKVKGSNATFYKDKIFSITIGNAPVTLIVESPHTVASGDNFTTTVSVALNSQDVLKNVVLKAEYPHGYSVTDVIPASVGENNIWALGDLSPGDKKTISIKGQLVGENEEERTFRFYVGVSDTNSANHNLKIAIFSLLNTVTIERPSIDLNVTFNGENVSTYVASAARLITTAIRFQNNLPYKLLNPRLEVRLVGPALDKFSVKVGNNGFYDSLNSKIVWNLANVAGHSELVPGENGQVSLSFASLPDPSPIGGSSEIALNLFLSGVPVGSLNQQSVTVNEMRTVKIASQVNLTSKVLYSLGSFTNHGPIPPKVEKETTYTATFNIGNTQNELTNAKVTARLGPGVSWIGASGAASEDVSYDASSNTVSWNLDTLSRDAGFSSTAREVSFQVALTPSISQIGTSPVLVSNITFVGQDVSSNIVTTVNNSPLTTLLTSDPKFIQGDDIVVK